MASLQTGMTWRRYFGFEELMFITGKQKYMNQMFTDYPLNFR